jgi:hypothetical protein
MQAMQSSQMVLTFQSRQVVAPVVAQYLFAVALA